MASLANALISGGGSILGGISGGKGAEKAAKIEAAAQQSAINEQQREFGVVQANNQPYMAAGTAALPNLEDLLGIGAGGASAQSTAIAALKDSPLFTSQYDTGLDALNQSEAATGGLRGGNGALAESNFGSNLLAQIIQGQIGNLGSVVGIGQAATGGTNSAALSTGNNISSELSTQGLANATAAISPYAAFQSILGGLGQAAGKYFSPPTNYDVVGSGYVPSQSYPPISVMSGYTGGEFSGKF